MLEHQKILVVGGSSGIGLAVAELAISAGAAVVIASRSTENLGAAALKLGHGVQIEQVDVTDPHSIAQLLDRVGEIDHLVATIKPKLPSGKFLENDISAIQKAFDAKFWGQYHLAKAVQPFIKPHGSIVLTSGIAACRSYPGYSAVAAMNAATEALTKALALELAPIRVNCVCPGFVDTNPPTPGREAYVKAISPVLPLARLGMATEIALAFRYLMENTYATGSVTVVDGGATC